MFGLHNNTNAVETMTYVPNVELPITAVISYKEELSYIPWYHF